jgi:hypothetical protein
MKILVKLKLCIYLRIICIYMHTDCYITFSDYEQDKTVTGNKKPYQKQ